MDWSSFARASAPGIHSIENLSNTLFTTSGRAAIYQALLLLNRPAGSTVLVPTYHCPTMVAPVLLANLKPAYFAIDADGLPLLDSIDATTIARSSAIIAAHYFGLPRSFAKLRQWCDQHGIALIEDCAHCYFGDAGERPVGAWGDYATASLSKFFPVPEAGLVASAHRSIERPALTSPALKAQVKGWIDVLEYATTYKRLAGLNRGLALLFGLKNARTPMPSVTASNKPSGPDEDDMMRDCDMGRIQQRPLWAAMTLKSILPRGRVILQRQKNYGVYARLLAHAKGARPLFSMPSASVAPYVFPLWVDDADRVYHALKAQSLPVFRWDRIWPGTPSHPADAGPLWSRHVLQLLCHQDLSEADTVRIANATLDLLIEPDQAALPPPSLHRPL
ncbi:hypothetical protein RD110_21555 [Rhodoferax koreense]|uniref:DegT/DnrJ/EryC1/StrS aminotransferase n=1 Tax=Rhodoferax koreensis TaxID=1842727 RepID=A0A1P8K0E8_9BURK|nr:hypothetical protein RD110_21555 [Rhodoferax koreense]